MIVPSRLLPVLSAALLCAAVHATGEGVIVAKYGHPFVMLVPFSPPPEAARSAHPLRGLPYRMAPDFDEPMPELALSVAESGPGFGASGSRKAVALSRVKKVPLVTADRKIRAYPYVETLWG